MHSVYPLINIFNRLNFEFDLAAKMYINPASIGVLTAALTQSHKDLPRALNFLRNASADGDECDAELMEGE